MEMHDQENKVNKMETQRKSRMSILKDVENLPYTEDKKSVTPPRQKQNKRVSFSRVNTVKEFRLDSCASLAVNRVYEQQVSYSSSSSMEITDSKIASALMHTTTESTVQSQTPTPDKDSSLTEFDREEAKRFSQNLTNLFQFGNGGNQTSDKLEFSQSEDPMKNISLVDDPMMGNVSVNQTCFQGDMEFTCGASAIPNMFSQTLNTSIPLETTEPVGNIEAVLTPTARNSIDLSPVKLEQYSTNFFANQTVCESVEMEQTCGVADLRNVIAHSTMKDSSMYFTGTAQQVNTSASDRSFVKSIFSKSITSVTQEAANGNMQAVDSENVDMEFTQGVGHVLPAIVISDGEKTLACPIEMEFTQTTTSGIVAGVIPDQQETISVPNDMEFTKVVGSVIPVENIEQQTISAPLDMDFTQPVSSIVTDIIQNQAATESCSVEMDLTEVIGSVEKIAEQEGTIAIPVNMDLTQPAASVAAVTISSRDETVDMEFTKPVGSVLPLDKNLTKAVRSAEQVETMPGKEQTMSDPVDMEFTQAVGSVIRENTDLTKAVELNNEVENKTGKEQTMFDPVDMEFTQAVGSVIRANTDLTKAVELSSKVENKTGKKQTMSDPVDMEFTQAVGSVIRANTDLTKAVKLDNEVENKTGKEQTMVDVVDMEFTQAVGSVIPPDTVLTKALGSDEKLETMPKNEQTIVEPVDMEFTRAVGSVIRPDSDLTTAVGLGEQVEAMPETERTMADPIDMEFTQAALTFQDKSKTVVSPCEMEITEVFGSVISTNVEITHRPEKEETAICAVDMDLKQDVKSVSNVDDINENQKQIVRSTICSPEREEILYGSTSGSSNDGGVSVSPVACGQTASNQTQSNEGSFPDKAHFTEIDIPADSPVFFSRTAAKNLPRDIEPVPTTSSNMPVEHGNISQDVPSSVTETNKIDEVTSCPEIEFNAMKITMNAEEGLMHSPAVTSTCEGSDKRVVESEAEVPSLVSKRRSEEVSSGQDIPPHKKGKYQDQCREKRKSQEVDAETFIVNTPPHRKVKHDDSLPNSAPLSPKHPQNEKHSEDLEESVDKMASMDISTNVNSEKEFVHDIICDRRETAVDAKHEKETPSECLKEPSVNSNTPKNESCFTSLDAAESQGLHGDNAPSTCQLSNDNEDLLDDINLTLVSENESTTEEESVCSFCFSRSKTFETSHGKSFKISRQDTQICEIDLIDKVFVLKLKLVECGGHLRISESTISPSIKDLRSPTARFVMEMHDNSLSTAVQKVIGKDFCAIGSHMEEIHRVYSRSISFGKEVQLLERLYPTRRSDNKLTVSLCSVKAHLSIDVLVEIQIPKTHLESRPKLDFKASVVIGNLSENRLDEVIRSSSNNKLLSSIKIIETIMDNMAS